MLVIKDITIFTFRLKESHLGNLNIVKGVLKCCFLICGMVTQFKKLPTFNKDCFSKIINVYGNYFFKECHITD